MKRVKFINSTIGEIGMCEQDGFITDIFLSENHMLSNNQVAESSVLDMAEKQLIEYFNGDRQSFNLPLKFSGTAFQKEVWNEIVKIPYGKTVAYKQIAIALNRPKSSRAIGMACAKNPILIVNPCHRVISCKGDISGYAGGVNVKKYLLQLENVDNNCQLCKK